MTKSQKTPPRDAKPNHDTASVEEAEIVLEGKPPTMEESPEVAVPDDDERPPDEETAAPSADAADATGARDSESEAMVAARPPARAHRRSGALALGLAGIVSAAAGAAAAIYVMDSYFPPVAPKAISELSSQIAAQSARSDALEKALAASSARLSKVAATAGNPALQGAFARLGTSVAGLGDKVRRFEARLSAQGAELRALTGRVTALEARPVVSANGTIGSAELKAALARLAAEQAKAVALAARVQKAASDASARATDAQKRAAALEARAKAEAEAAVAQLTLARLGAAIDTGGPFAGVLSALKGVNIPKSLRDMSSQGVPTRADLQREFPDAARAGLSASLKAQGGRSVLARMGAFVRSQVGARSLTPQSGSSPDAILSRAAAELASGRLAAALADIKALPKEGQAAMAQWLARARARLAAIAALRELAATLDGK